MINRILNALWYLRSPKYWLHFIYMLKCRYFLPNYDTPTNIDKAKSWAINNAVSYNEAFAKVGLKGNFVGLDNDTLSLGKQLATKSKVKMGGPGNVHLLYDAVKTLKAQKVIETGVAYGWSSLAILKALTEIGNGKLYSVDMPYPRRNNEKDVGIVVPKSLKKNWFLTRRPDQPGILEVIKMSGGDIDLCHYDSDKSWWGRNYAYPLLWEALKVGGLFICDDIQDNLFFLEFVRHRSLKFSVIEYNGKFIGLIRKI